MKILVWSRFRVFCGGFYSRRISIYIYNLLQRSTRHRGMYRIPGDGYHFNLTARLEYGIIMVHTRPCKPTYRYVNYHPAEKAFFLFFSTVIPADVHSVIHTQIHIYKYTRTQWSHKCLVYIIYILSYTILLQTADQRQLYVGQVLSSFILLLIGLLSCSNF